MHGNKVQRATLDLVKWALGYELTMDNADCLEHNVARVLFLHTFDLDLNDVANAIEAEKEIEWKDKRITKDFIVRALRSDLKERQEKDATHPVNDWWFASGELCAIQLLNTFDVDLADLRHYFQYEEALLNSLKYHADAEECSTDASLISHSDDPTWVSDRIWQGQVTTTPGAAAAVETHANDRDAWDVSTKGPRWVFRPTKSWKEISSYRSFYSR